MIDCASYHTALTEDSKTAGSNLRKSQLIDWLLKKGVEHSVAGTIYRARDDYTTLKVVGQVKICKENKPKPVFQVHILAAKFDCVAFFLPISHLELNPIEMCQMQFLNV
ncbi:hypothetical protein BBO99_00007014 [Phytophthora kernoviae]|uniref:Uncharacterized protein n=1 Tax=Phytophthora kernoviae TaxID=325452 RepID=A0A3R7IQL3_9STRA|nr:hypothetical protein BBI17_007019 [Phytophthora kernoviae]RLN77110.1 hypothetical protein BBO99_00007014 [Phytophthora kernoviae]